MSTNNVIASSLNAIVKNDKLKPVFHFINKWAIENRGCQHYYDDGDAAIWVNDYVEYILAYDDDISECMLIGYNVELNRHLLFYIPTGQTAGFFDNIISLVGHS